MTSRFLVSFLILCLMVFPLKQGILAISGNERGSNLITLGVYLALVALLIGLHREVKR